MVLDCWHKCQPRRFSKCVLSHPRRIVFLRLRWGGARRKGKRRTLCTEELSRDVQGFAADDNDLLATEELLGDDAGETTKKMALAVDDNLEGMGWLA